MAIHFRKLLSCIWNLNFYLLACLSLIDARLSSDQDTSTSHPVVRWLREEHPHFYLNKKLSVQDDDTIQVQESLHEYEILMVIPSSAVITVIDNLEEELVEDIFCSLAARLWNEMLAGNNSTLAPYVQYVLKKHKTEPTIPNFWSTIGKRLIGMVYGSFLPTDFLIDWMEDFENCQEFLKLDDEDAASNMFQSYENDYTTIHNSDVDNARRHVMAITAWRQTDQLHMIPLYDQLEHHPVANNVHHLIRRKDLAVMVLADRAISPGETLYRPSQACLFECVEPKQAIVLDLLRNFGKVPPYPHFWDMPDMELTFTIHAAAENDAVTPTTTWLFKPEQPWQVEKLESRYERLQNAYKEEVLKSVGTVPPHEWRVIEEYSSALLTALRIALEKGKEELLLRAAKDGDSKDQLCSAESSEGECIAEEKVDVDSMEGGSTNDEKGPETKWDPWSITRKSCSNCTLEELEESRRCTEYTYNTIHNESTWTHLRAAYVAVMGEESTINATYRSGIRVPFKIDYSPGRGRGVFAMEDISKGTLLWSGQEHTAALTTGKQFRQFLSVLPDVLVCDLANWCYTSEETATSGDVSPDDEEYKHVIECDLDEGECQRQVSDENIISFSTLRSDYSIGSLINAYDVKEEHNLGCTDDVVEDLNLCSHNLYALRNIRKGEELVTDYADFSTASWEDFGL